MIIEYLPSLRLQLITPPLFNPTVTVYVACLYLYYQTDYCFVSIFLLNVHVYTHRIIWFDQIDNTIQCCPCPDTLCITYMSSLCGSVCWQSPRLNMVSKLNVLAHFNNNNVNIYAFKCLLIRLTMFHVWNNRIDFHCKLIKTNVFTNFMS